jgi:nucleotide-binding universal stress UspA family protein
MSETPWRGFGSILCAVDFSELSALALQYAVTVARHGGAALTTLHVADPLLTAAASAALHDRDAVLRSQRELRLFVDAYALKQGGTAALTRSERVVIGEAADEILGAAADIHAGLLVVGTAGLTGAERLIMGSTTRRILGRSPIPVLAVPPLDKGTAPPASQWPGELAVLAVALDTRTEQEIRTAAGIAAWFNTSLLIVHVKETSDAAAARRLEALAASVRAEVAARAMVVTGDVGQTISAVAAREGAGLVMTVLREREGWFGPQRGSVSYQVVSESAIPVLALPGTGA